MLFHVVREPRTTSTPQINACSLLIAKVRYMAEKEKFTLHHVLYSHIVLLTCFCIKLLVLKKNNFILLVLKCLWPGMYYITIVTQL